MNAMFRWLWASAGLANLGDGIIITALPLISIAAGGQPSEVALVTTAATIAWPIAGLHAGWVVDKIPPHRLLALVNSARTLALIGLSLSIAFETGVLVVTLASALIFGFAETLVDTALIAGIPRTVSRNRLVGANARIEATVNINNQLAGPPLAGLLVGSAGLLAATTGAALYLLAGVAALGLMHSMRRSHSEYFTTGIPAAAEIDNSAGKGRAEIRVRDGIRLLWRHRLQRELTLMTAAMSVIWGAWTATFVLHAVAPGPLGLDPAGYGLLLTTMALGGIIASMLTERLQTRISPTSLLFIDTIGTIGLVLPAALNAPLAVVAAGIVLAGSGSTVWRIIVAVVRQKSTPLHLIGRVYSASRVISWGALPLGATLAAMGVGPLGLTSMFWIESALSAGISTWFAIRMPTLRSRMDEAAAPAPGEMLFNHKVDNEDAEG